MNEETAAMLDYVRAALNESGAHGFDHTLRVVRLCEEIGAREGADMAVLIPAAIFHDIARPLEEKTGVPHEEEGARMAAAYLEAVRYPKDRIAGIVHAIRAHRYSTGIDPETLEARVLSDADNLDAMGAVGIARTFMQAATLRPERSSSTVRCEVRLATGDLPFGEGVPETRRVSTGGTAGAIDHFHDKLLNLKNCMYTESARAIAEKRHALLVAFLAALEDEMHPRPLSDR